jgi:hypothetical protein
MDENDPMKACIALKALAPGKPATIGRESVFRRVETKSFHQYGKFPASLPL